MSQPSWIGHALGGRYRIEELIGQGGMSSVYKATDPNLKRPVAVKLIHPHLSVDAEFVRRFEIEAAAVARMRHPNIIQVFDFNHEADTYYMVLEYVPGETLQDRLKRLDSQNRRLSLAEVIHIGSSIADALEYAHRRGMIHRDVKPANVMLNVQGEAILMDFGIAKIVGATHFTATGAVLGTALYMAPEQIRGERSDHRADIYSLGVMLFEMVSGRPPFEADSAMSVMMMHLNEPVPDLTAWNPQVDAYLKTLIETALAKDPAKRIGSAAELAADLRDLGGRQPAPSEPLQPGSANKLADYDQPPGFSTLSAPSATGSPTPSRASATRPPAASEALSPSRPTTAATRPPMSRPVLALLGSGAVLGIFLIVFGLSRIFGGGTATPPSRNPSPPPPSQEIAFIVPSATPTATAPVPDPPPEIPTPSEIPPPTPTPTATVPTEPYVRIDDIGISNDRYVVFYETFGYTESTPGTHVHFFWNTVDEADAGIPGPGPWTVYGGPRPFEDFIRPDRPLSATQICARVANSDHTIQLGSGNCFDLPDV